MRILQADPKGCLGSKEWSDDMACSATTIRNPIFSLNFAHLEKVVDGLCSFLKTKLGYGISFIAGGPGVCRAVSKCIVDAIPGGRKFKTDDCIEDAFKGLLQDTANKMTTLMATLRQVNGFVTDLVGKLYCNTDPTSGLKSLMTVLTKLVRAFNDIPKNLQKALDVTKELIKPFDSQFSDTTKISVLFSIDLGIVVGKDTRGVSNGIYVTFDAIYIAKYRLNEIIDLWDLIKTAEIGLFEGHAHGETTDAGAQISTGGTIQLLQGSKDKWGGFGFDISLSVDADALIGDGGLTIGAVFSAAENSDGTQNTGEFLGVLFSAGVSAGPSSPLPVSLSRSCGFINFVEAKKKLQCKVENVKDLEKKMKPFFEKIGKDWTDLWDRCQNAWECRFSKCENAVVDLGKQLVGCAPGQIRKCTRSDKNYCTGSWKKVVGHCIRFETKSVCTNKLFGCDKETENRVKKCGWDSKKWWEIWKLICKWAVTGYSCAEHFTCKAYATVFDLGKCLKHATTKTICDGRRIFKCMNWDSCVAKQAVNGAATLWKCADSLAPFKPVSC